MSKKYVIEKAVLNCKHGSSPCVLVPRFDRHLYVGDQLIANESDIIEICFKENFGSCRSPYAMDIPLEVKDALFSGQQLVPYSGLPCKVDVMLPWQNAKENVHFGIEGYKALMEDGWTICQSGLGIITLTDSGQTEENPVQTMTERLEALENIVDAYMKDNGIKAKYKGGLMESVLLWNGYQLEDTPWEYESSEMKRNFCSFLEQEKPYLSNYFERGLYIHDEKDGVIDLSYMMGINKALNKTSDPWECVTQTVAEDRGMYNGYLEACRQERGKESYEILRDFLNQYSSSDYNGAGRYTDYINTPIQTMRDMYCSQNFYDPESLTETEQNFGVLNNMITGRIQSLMYTDKADLYEAILEQEKQADEISQRFLNALRKDLEGEK